MAHTMRRLSLAGAVVVAVGAGCGSEPSGGPSATAPVTEPPATNDPSSATTTSTSTSATTTIAAASTTPTAPTSSTTPPPTTTSSTPPASTGDLAIGLPAGTFESGPADLFVLTRDGDLELWSDALVPPVGPRTLVADYPDPFATVNEGSGPNVIDHVAGIVGGSVVFGDCCEPISGSLLAATAPDELARIGGGYSPTLSPTGDLLGVANDYVISQTAADRTGQGIFRQVNEAPEGPYLNVRDVTWSSNGTAAGDDDHLVVLGWTTAGWSLYDVDRATLELTAAGDLGPADPQRTGMVFVGHGPDAEIVVADAGDSTIRLRYFSPTTLSEIPDLERSLPASATSVRLGGDGIELLWVDGEALYRLPAGTFEPIRLGTGVLAAWYA